MISHQNAKFIFNVNILNNIMMNYLQTMHIQMMKQQQQNTKFQQMMMNMRIETITITSTFIFLNSLYKKPKTQLFKIELYNEKTWFYTFSLNSKSKSNYLLTKKQLMMKKINFNTFLIF